MRVKQPRRCACGIVKKYPFIFVAASLRQMSLATLHANSSASQKKVTFSQEVKKKNKQGHADASLNGAARLMSDLPTSLSFPTEAAQACEILAEQKISSDSCRGRTNFGAIVLEMKDGSAGQPYPLVERQYVFGGQPTCDIWIQSPTVSKEQARIEVDRHDHVWLLNLSQDNPIHVNGTVSLSAIQLSHGDQFAIGGRAFTYERRDVFAFEQTISTNSSSPNQRIDAKAPQASLCESKQNDPMPTSAGHSRTIPGVLDFKSCGDKEVTFSDLSQLSSSMPSQLKAAPVPACNRTQAANANDRKHRAYFCIVFLFSVALALCHVHLVLAAAATITVTFDETAHVGAGVTFWKYKDFRLNPENGVLPQLIAGAGIMWGRPGTVYAIPTFQQQAWIYSDCWSIGYQLLHESGNNLANILHDGRRGIAFCSGAAVFATGLIAFFAFISMSPSNSVPCGAAAAIGAFVACTLCALDPSLIAHGGLMTSDTVLTLFWLVSPVLLWHSVVTAAAPNNYSASRRTSVGRRMLSLFFILMYLIVTGAVAGLLVASKHSGVLIAPVLIAFLALLIHFYARELGLIAAFLWTFRAIVALAVITCAALFTFWGCYFFRFSAFADGEVGRNEQWLSLWNNVDYLPRDGLVKQVLLLLRQFDALPQAFQYGFSYAYKSAQARNAFLIGAHSAGGWKSFFPIAVAIKTPVAALALLALSFLLLLTRFFFRLKIFPRASNVGTAKPSLFPALIIPFVLYWAVAVHTNLNIGHRHMLPSYPPMFIFAAYCVFLPLAAPPGPFFVRVFVRTATLCVAAAGLVALVWEVQPHLLAPIPFFNVLVGGPSNGYKFLVDSSLDWGQDLPRFSALVNATRAVEKAAGRDEPVFYLSYFGWGHPPSHGLDDSRGVVYVHSSVSGTSTMPRHMRSLTMHMEGGSARKKVFLAVGASIFQGVYNSVATGTWNAWFELQYRRMRRCLKRLHSSGKDDFMSVMSELPRFKEFALNYDGYRLARMCAGLRNVSPDFNVGNSILVFELSQKRLAALLDGPTPAEVGTGDMPYLKTAVEMP